MYSQGYFDGKQLHCPSTNSEARKNFSNGIELLHLNYSLKRKYLELNSELFARAISQDTTFCDAYFFAGYTLNLLNKYRESYAFHKVADKLSPIPIFIFKQNLAAVSLKVGLFDEARKQYLEIVKHFPENPEGYYGIALTSPMLEDYSVGLSNLDMASDRFPKNSKEQEQVTFIRGILLALNKEYNSAKINFDKVEKKYKTDLNFQIYYSLALLQISKVNDDIKMKKEALKYYKKIKDKSVIPPHVNELLVF
jgi:tetratricopeptide (TPR) repeat protein